MKGEYETRDAAVLAALSSMEPGDETLIHEESCKALIDQHDTCTCEPVLMVRPAPSRPIGFRKP
jgi:hypothetical protein